MVGAHSVEDNNNNNRAKKDHAAGIAVSVGPLVGT